MKVKEIIELLQEMDGDLEVDFIESYGVGIEIVTKDEDFYYGEKDKKAITELKQFQKELIKQQSEEKDLSFEEKVKERLRIWREE